MNTLKVILLFLTSLTISQADDSWLFVKPGSINYDSTSLEIITDLLKRELQIQGKIPVQLTNCDHDTTDLESNQQHRVNTLLSSQSMIGISFKISRMNNTLFFYVYKWNKLGEIIYQESFSVSTSVAVDALTKRIARSLLLQKTFAQTAQSDNITTDESKSPLVKNGSVLTFLRAGMLYPIGSSFSVHEKIGTNKSKDSTTFHEGNAFSMEIGVGYGLKNLIMQCFAGFDGRRNGYLGIGGDYLFLSGDFSPYLGLDLNASMVNKSEGFDYATDNQMEKDSDGLGVGVRIGFMFFRNSSYKFTPEIRFINVFNDDMDNGIRGTVGVMTTF